LAAIVGGTLYALQSLLWPSYQEDVFFLFLVLGAMAAIGAVAVLLVPEGERWRMLLTPLIALLGVALMFVYVLASLTEQNDVPVVVRLLFVGLLVSTVGLLLLGIVVINIGVLPWWGGAALIAGSPLLAFVLRFLEVSLPGVVWTVAGYAIFRAATHLPEHPSRVR
jgi:hypothetical protein